MASLIRGGLRGVGTDQDDYIKDKERYVLCRQSGKQNHLAELSASENILRDVIPTHMDRA